MEVSEIIRIFAAENKRKNVIMSTATLTNLRDYLTGTLSKSDMAWRIKEIETYMHGSEAFPLKRYTKEEINAMLDEAEADIAAGRVSDHEDVMREWEEELAREEQEELELAEAV